jgi:hypothetical protein
MRLPSIDSPDDGGANNQEAREANHIPIKRKLFLFVFFVSFLRFCLVALYFIQSVENGNSALNVKGGRPWVFASGICAQFCFYVLLRTLFGRVGQLAR